MGYFSTMCAYFLRKNCKYLISKGIYLLSFIHKFHKRIRINLEVFLFNFISRNTLH